MNPVNVRNPTTCENERRIDKIKNIGEKTDLIPMSKIHS
jgi:hypothetical protein